MELLKAILGQSAPDFSALAAQQLSSVYGPQHQIINNLRSQANSNATTSNAALKAMYAALQKDIGAQSATINRDYNTEKTGISNAYTGGRKQIANTYTQANNEVVAKLDKLGISAAASDPRLLAQNAQDSSFLQGLLTSSNQGAQNAANLQQKSSLDYNTGQRNAAGAAGIESRNALAALLSNRLSDLGNQELGVSSQQAAAQNTLMTQLSSNYTSQQQQLASMLYQSYADKEAAQEKLNTASQPTTYQQFQMMGPMDKAYAEAAKLFGTGNDAASQAVNLAMSIDPNQTNNPYQYINAVLEKNRQAGASALPEDQLRTIVAYIWDQMNPNTASSYGQSPYGY
jgi:hypothetical protein